MSKSKDRTSNDQRSIVKNPTSREFELDKINQEKQQRANKKRQP